MLVILKSLFQLDMQNFTVVNSLLTGDMAVNSSLIAYHSSSIFLPTSCIKCAWDPNNKKHNNIIIFSH